MRLGLKSTPKAESRRELESSGLVARARSALVQSTRSKNISVSAIVMVQ